MTITKRSNHMPIEMMKEITKSAGTLWRTFLNHSGWIARKLQKIRSASPSCRDRRAG